MSQCPRWEALRQRIRETDTQKALRLENEFHVLEMGRMSHVEFRTKFEDLVFRMTVAGLEGAANPSFLHRQDHSWVPGGSACQDLALR